MEVSINALTIENEVIIVANKYLSEKAEDKEEEKVCFMNKKELCKRNYAELQTRMEEMKSKYGDICTRSSLVCTKNEALTDKNEILQ